MLRLESLELRNFRAISEGFISFEPGVTLVRGQVLDDAHYDSNGAGKSSLLTYSIPYVLFGKYRSSTGEVERTNVVTEGEHQGYVKLSLKIGDQPYVITRGRRGNKPFLTVQKGSDDAESMAVGSTDLEHLIGCSFEDFHSLFILSRFAVENNLFYGTPAKRREFLMSLVGLDRMSREAIDILKQYRTGLTTEADNLTILKSSVGSAEDLEFHIKSVMSQLKRKQQEAAEFPNKLAQLEDEKQRLGQMLDRVDADLRKVTSELERAEQSLQRTEAYDKLVEEARALRDVVAQISTELNIAHREYSEMQRLKVGICPHCKQKVTKTHIARVQREYKQKIQSLTALLEPRKAQLQEVENEARAVKQAYEEVRARREALLRSVQELRTSRERAAARLDSIREQYNQLVSSYQKLNADIIELREQLRDLKRLYDVKLNRLDSLTHDINCFTSLAAACNAWIDFLRDDLPKVALSRILSLFERFVNACLASLSNFSVRLQDVEGSPEVILDRPLRSTSSGELSRVFLSLAIGAVLAARYVKGWYCNTLVLDEVFDSLDAAGRSCVYSLLSDVAERFGLCIFVISHHSGDVFEDDARIITVRKEGYRSVVLTGGGVSHVCA